MSVPHVEEGGQWPGNWSVVSHRERAKQRERGTSHARELSTATVPLIPVQREMQVEAFIARS